MAHRNLSLFIAVLTAGACALPGSVLALQPLDAFLRAAKRDNFGNREASATTEQRVAETDAARGKLYPSFAASGSYTRNQYEVTFPLGMTEGGKELVIQPYNQLDANVSISIPLVDVSAWKRLAAAETGAEASGLNERATALDVETQVCRAYFQLLGQEAVLEASKSALELARANLNLVQDKLAGGTASELEIQRGRAEIARAQGDLASAELAVINARRQLATTTRLEPEPAHSFSDDDLHEEAPLAGFLSRAPSTPRAQLAALSRRTAEQNVAVSEAAWLPTLSASAQERFTNATSFSGRAAVYLLQATLSWRLDASVPANVRTQAAALHVSEIRNEQATRAVEDTIYQAWHQVRAAIEKARAARAQRAASQYAAELARDRYSVGAATHLDVIQAQQEAFRSEVARIQADTELTYARLALRSSSGQALEGTQP